MKNLPLTIGLDNNHLTASDPELIAWLNRRNPSWDKTQTPCSPGLQFSSASYSVVENTGEYATSDDTATASDDYTQTSGTLSWDDGDDADKTFPMISEESKIYFGRAGLFLLEHKNLK